MLGQDLNKSIDQLAVTVYRPYHTDTGKPLSKHTSEIPPPPLSGYHCSACLSSVTLTCTFTPSEIQNEDTSTYRTAYCGPSGVLIIEVPLYRTVYCGPNGVLIIEGLLYRTVYRGPNSTYGTGNKTMLQMADTFSIPNTKITNHTSSVSNCKNWPAEIQALHVLGILP